MSRLKAVALVLSGALASMLFCGWLIVGHIESDAGALAEAREEGYAAAEEDRLAIVVDRPIAEGNSMPLRARRFLTISHPSFKTCPMGGLPSLA